MENSKDRIAMIIDDNEIDIFINKRVLRITSLFDKIISFQSAEEALRNLRENSIHPENLPEVIFLDIRMPGMNGFQFLDEFGKLPKTIIHKMKIFMLTSSIDENDMNKAKRNPFVNNYVIKPLKQTNVFELMG